ncbi:type II toxin-antitoxin system VapC family toxin [bacterium CPR1]|nr:type II toxin-antitoxin system VapC family toxin [bacterium CPR1]
MVWRGSPIQEKTHLKDRFELILSEILRAEWTDDVSYHFGASKAFLERAGQVIEDFDLAIAAHALARGAILVTSNRKPMQRLPNIDLEDWGPSVEGAAP